MQILRWLNALSCSNNGYWGLFADTLWKPPQKINNNVNHKKPIQLILSNNSLLILFSSKLLLKGPAKFPFCNQNIAFEGYDSGTSLVPKDLT